MLGENKTCVFYTLCLKMKHTGTTVNNSVALLPNRMLQIGRAIMKKDRETKKEITKERKNE